jgi:hypothetical protein
MVLYQCKLNCKIPNFPSRTEYLRAKNATTLIKMFAQCENIEGSVYYGYELRGINRMWMKDFPEVKTMRVKI